MFVASIALAQTGRDRVALLGSGVNLSEWLEAYWETNYPVWEKYREEDIAFLKDLGFRHIRLPVAFTLWTDTTPPYTIDTTIFLLVDSVIQWCMKHDLRVVISYHHGRLGDRGSAEFPRIMASWRQIAHWFRHTDPEYVFWDLYNEPHNITHAQWRSFVSELVDSMRQWLPEHTFIVAPADWSGIDQLDSLQPLSDLNIIYTVHVYRPFLFTHQGASWTPCTHITGYPFPYDPARMPQADSIIWNNPFCAHAYANYPQWATVTWLRAHIEKAAQWSQDHQVPIYIGELGVYYKAPYADRLRWLHVVTCTADSLNIPWANWGFKYAESSFGFVYGGIAHRDNVQPGFMESICLLGDSVPVHVLGPSARLSKKELFPMGVYDLWGRRVKIKSQSQLMKAGRQGIIVLK